MCRALLLTGANPVCRVKCVISCDDDDPTDPMTIPISFGEYLSSFQPVVMFWFSLLKSRFLTVFSEKSEKKSVNVTDVMLQ